VPAGAWIGQQVGWRMTFWAVSALGLVALAAVVWLVPRGIALGEPPSLRSAWRIVRRPRLAAALTLTALGFGGIFTTLTYLAPLLQAGPGFSPSQINALLLLFGLGLTLGNIVGGWADDRWRGRSMTVILAALIASELALHLLLSQPVAVAVVIFLWGAAAFATAPGLQARVLDEAQDAPALASTLNIGAFNLGNAVAAWLGARGLEAGLGLSRLPLVSAALAAAALLLLATLSRRTPQPQPSVK